MRFDDVFSSVRSSILITEPLPDVKTAFATLSIDESHRVNNVHCSVDRSGSTVFVSRVIMIGLLIGYPERFKKNSKGNNLKVVANNVTTYGSSNSSGTPIGSNIVFFFASCKFFNMNTNISTYSAYVGWIIDFGATQHMTYFIMFLLNVIDVSHLYIIVAHPNGTVVKVNQIGSFILIETLIIHDVLVVPGYDVSLLSVHKLASTNKVSVIFNEIDCLIEDSIQKSLVGTGSMIGGLYFLDQGKKHIVSNIKTCVVSKCLWYNRLGHPVDQVLKVLRDKIDLDDTNVGLCDVCHKAKQTREPFPLSNHKTSDLELWACVNLRSKRVFDPKRLIKRGKDKVKALGANGLMSGYRVRVVWMEVGGRVVSARVVLRVVLRLVMKVVLVMLRD
nr:hypothetical protein [Tanacetum cinerariifolium]